MGRLGVSYLEVAHVAAGLQGKGMNPTVDAVRESLGTGSRSTIGPYLKQWRSHQTTISHASELPDQLVSLVKGLYERIQCEAHLKMAEAANFGAEEINRLQQIVEQLKNQIASLEASHQELNAKLEVAIDAGALFKTELENQQKLNISLSTKINESELRLKDRNRQIHSLEKQLMHSQDRLENSHESYKRLQQEWHEQKGKTMALQEQLHILIKEENQ